jgi:predicted anti-sigma-YlaC factor YlaD
MKHQPFETWILLDETLTSEQTRQLEDHLHTCEHCRQLRDAWIGAQTLMGESQALEPALGFTQRWEERLHLERRKQLLNRHQWHAWIILILIANVVSILAVVLGIQFFATYDSLAEVLLIWVYRIASFLTVVNVLQNFISTLLSVIPGLLPTGGWVALAGVLITGMLLWIVFMASLVKIPRRLQS